MQERYEVAADEEGRLDRLVQQLTGLSRARVRGLFDHGCVSLNGEACSAPGQMSRIGDVLEVDYDPERRYREKPRLWQDEAFKIAHEDDAILVVDKAAGILTVPTDQGEDECLVSFLSRYLGKGRKGSRSIEVVHRLDRDTSGLLVFAKSVAAKEALQEQFASREPDREYLSLVAGNPATMEGTFRSHLVTSKSLFRYSTRRPGRGELAVTHYRVEEQLKGAALVRARLETGRRNQIRVHFAEAGRPVLGDTRYRADLARHPSWRAKRLALHACVLGFRHPETGAPLRFESPLPKEFEKFLAKTRVR